MTMTRITFRYILILTLTLVVASCGSSRKGALETSPGYGQGAEITWTDMSVPVSVAVTSPSRLSASGTLTMERDRYIHLSLRFLGMEVGAAYVTSDSVFAYSKLQRIYIAESISQALAGADLSLGTMQKLITGQPLALPSGSAGTRIAVKTLPSTGQPLEITVTHPSGRSAELTYVPLEDTPLAESFNVEVTTGKTPLRASMTLNWHRASIDTGSSRSFSIPSGYRRVAGADLIKSLGKM